MNEILDLSRIEAGGFHLESVPFDLQETVGQVIKTLGVRANEKGLELLCDLGDVPDRLVGDPLRLRQVLVNLVGNAIKFTPKGEVVVSASVVIPSPSGRGAGGEGKGASPHPHPLPEGEGTVMLEFAVTDTGIGIDREDQERIFSPFTQADASTTRHYGGTGLGLTITQRLVHLMGGRIWVESEFGSGSTFRFTARLGLHGEMDEEPGLPAVSREPLRDLPVLIVAETPSRRLRVLLAEDIPANQKLVSYILSKRGHAVELVQNGQQVLEAVGQAEFDVVLMDVQMPVMDGFQATQAIRKLADPKKARLPIIAMTAHALKGDANRCLDAGMDGYISKPVKGEELIELVERMAEGTAERHADLTPQTAEAAIPSEKPLAAVPVAVFDLDEAVSKCYGEYGMVQEMVGCLFNEADVLVEQMRTALANGEAIAMANAAHRLKGTVAHLGAHCRWVPPAALSRRAGAAI